MPARYLIGVDLGTTNSAVAYVDTAAADPRVRVFEVGVRYPEREVNALLAVWHPDTAALRRYLVDEGLLTREAGLYWRSGGRVDV